MDSENQTTPTQISTQKIPPVSPVSKINLATSVLFLLLGILIGASGFWVYQNYLVKKPSVSTTFPTPTPTPDPTANWETYSNDDYKFVFKYPHEWRVVPSTVEPRQQEIVITHNPDTKDAYLERNPGGFDQSKKSDVVINGVPITRIKNNKDVYRREYAIIPLTNGTLIIMGTLDVEVNQNQISSYDQILSTFKFLDNTNEGILKATVIRSPTCAGPITNPKNCEAPVVNETLNITKPSDNNIIQSVHTDKDGKFTVSLASGSYKLQNSTGRINKFGGVGNIIGNSTFTITAGKTITQRFDVDTGIR